MNVPIITMLLIHSKSYHIIVQAKKKMPYEIQLTGHFFILF